MSSVNIPSVKERVESLLETSKSLRDSDEKLIATVWYNDLKNKGFDPEKMTAFDFLQKLADGDLTNCQSIHRARRDIQKNNPNLRGENQAYRMAKEQRIRDQFKS